MHNHHEALSSGLQMGLAAYYFLVALLNVWFVSYWRARRNSTQVLIWSVVAAVFLIHSIAYLFRAGWVLPEGIRHLVNDVMNPVSYFVLAAVGFVALLRFRRTLTAPPVAWGILSVLLLFAGWALT